MEVLDNSPQRALGNYSSRLGIQGRQRREINVRRLDAEEGEQVGTSGSTSQRTEGSGASYVPKYTPLMYVPEKQRIPESGASPGPPGSQYLGRTPGGGTDSYQGRSWAAPAKAEPTDSLLSTSRGLFKMRPRRNIRVKSLDEVEDDRSAPERPSSAKSTGDNSEVGYSTGFLREPVSGGSGLARRDRHTVSDLLGARKAASVNTTLPQPQYPGVIPPPSSAYLAPGSHPYLSLGGDPQSELHVLQPIADLFSKYHNSGLQPLETRHPPVGCETGIVPMEEAPPPSRTLMFTDNKPFFLDDELPDACDGGQDEAEACSQMMLEGVNQKVVVEGNFPGFQDGADVLVDGPSEHLDISHIPATQPHEERKAPAESYEERIAALKAKMRETSLVATSNVASQPETLDERKERILGNLYKQKYGEPIEQTAPTGYETLDMKREKILANLRRKHSTNLQAQDLLGHMEGRTRNPTTFSRSMSLGATLREDEQLADWLPQREEWLPQREEYLAPRDWIPHEQHHLVPRDWTPRGEEHLAPNDWLPPRDPQNVPPAAWLPPAAEINAQVLAEEQAPCSEPSPSLDMVQSELVPTIMSEENNTQANLSSQVFKCSDSELEVPFGGRRESSKSRDQSPSQENRTSVFVKLRPTQSNASREIRESSKLRSGSFQIRAGTGTKSFIDRSDVAKNVGRSRSQRGSPNDEVMSEDSGFHDKMTSESKLEPPVSKTPPEFDSSKRRGSNSSSASGSSKADSIVPKSPGPVRRNYLKPWTQGGSTEAPKSNTSNTLPKKKTGPPTKPKPQSPSQPQPRSKSTPPSKSKSTTNLTEVGLTTPREGRERSSSVVKDSDYPEKSAFSRNSRLRSSTKAWEQRQSEKPKETKKPAAAAATTKANPPPKVPPKPAAPKKAQPGIVGKVTLLEDVTRESKGTHTPRNSSNYDKPWRTGSALARPGSSSPASLQPGSASSRAQSPSGARTRRISVSASSSRSHSPSTNHSRRGSMDLLSDATRPPKNPVKGQGSVETKGGPRSPKSTTHQRPENAQNTNPQVSDKPNTNRLSEDEYKSLLDLAADWLFAEEETPNEEQEAEGSSEGKDKVNAKVKDRMEASTFISEEWMLPDSLKNGGLCNKQDKECVSKITNDGESSAQDRAEPQRMWNSDLESNATKDTVPGTSSAEQSSPTSALEAADHTESKAQETDHSESKALHPAGISKYSMYATVRPQLSRPSYGRLVEILA